MLARLQGADDHGFHAAFFEVYGHEALLRQFDIVEAHPAVLNGTRPDWVARSGGDSVVLELTSTALSDAALARERRLNVMYDQIDRLPTLEFYLSVVVKSVGPSNPPLGTLKNDLARWARDIDPERRLRESEATGLTNRPTYYWQRDGWSVEFGALPWTRGEERPGIRSPAIAMRTDASRPFTDDVRPVREKLRDKAHKYGRFDCPYVVGVLVDGFSDDRSIAAALYGDDVYIFRPDNPAGGREARRPNGLWASTKGWRNENVSGVLAASRLSPWTVATTVPTLWHHPSPTHPVQVLFPYARQIVPNTQTGQVTIVEPLCTPAEYFDLDARWPGDPVAVTD